MLRALLRLISTQPTLLADHVQAYAELAADEFGQARAAWQRRLLLQAVCLCSLAVSAVLAGVALMLWAVIPEARMQAPWALLAAPLLPLLLALCCGCLAQSLAAKPALNGGQSGTLSGAFPRVREQLAADRAMLSEAAAR